jgi:hypothetical protein
VGAFVFYFILFLPFFQARTREQGRDNNIEENKRGWDSPIEFLLTSTKTVPKKEKDLLR